MSAVPQRAQRLYAVWSALPDGPLTERQLEEAILRILHRPGAQADASAYLAMLTDSRAVVATNGTFQKATEFPKVPEPAGPGTQEYDRQTALMAARQEEEFDRSAEEAFRNSPQNTARIELIALIDARIDERILELRRLADSAAIRTARQFARAEQRGENGAG